MNSSGWTSRRRTAPGCGASSSVARQAIVSVWLNVSARADAVPQRRRCGSVGRQCVVIDGLQSRRRVAAIVGRRSVSWPVRARNTSSSVGLAHASPTRCRAVPRAARSARRRRWSASASGDVEAARLRGQHRLLAEHPRDDAPRPRRCGRGSASRSCSVESPTDGLELVGRALGDLAAAVDDRDPVGELVGLVEVLRGEQHRAAVARRASRIVSHIWPRVRGSRPVVGSSRKISGGRRIRLAARSSRRRMPPENFAIGRSAASSRPNCASRSSARRPRLAAGQPEQPAEQPQVLAGGEVLVDRGVLPGDADAAGGPRAGCVRDVDAEDLGLAAVDRQQRREHLRASWSCRRRWGRARRRPRRGGRRGRCRRRRGRRRSS